MVVTVEGYEENELQILKAVGIPSETIDELFEQLSHNERVEYLYELSKHNIPQINNYLRLTVIKLILFNRNERLHKN